MKIVDRDTTLDSAVSAWFRKFLEDNRREMSFDVVGPRLILTGDGALLFVRHDSRTPWKPGKPLEPFVLVHSLCLQCGKVVRSTVQCRNWDAIKHERAMPHRDYTHICGAVENALGILGWLELYEGCVDRVLAKFYGMTADQMDRGYAFTRLGPAKLLDGDAKFIALCPPDECMGNPTCVEDCRKCHESTHPAPLDPEFRYKPCTTCSRAEYCAEHDDSCGERMQAYEFFLECREASKPAQDDATTASFEWAHPALRTEVEA